MDKNDSRSPAMSSYTSGRSPSPSLLDSLDPVVTSGNASFSSASNHPSFVHNITQQPQGRHMMQSQRQSPPATTTIHIGREMGKEPLSSVDALHHHNYYHLQYPPQTQKSMQSSSVVGDQTQPTHSQLTN